MSDWIKEKLTNRERIAYRIAMRNAKDPEKVDDEFFTNFVIQPERLNKKTIFNLKDLKKKLIKFIEEKDNNYYEKVMSDKLYDLLDEFFFKSQF